MISTTLIANFIFEYLLLKTVIYAVESGLSVMRVGLPVKIFPMFGKTTVKSSKVWKKPGRSAVNSSNVWKVALFNSGFAA